MSDSYRTQNAAEYGDVRPSEQVTMLDFSGDFLRQAEQGMPDSGDDSGTERHGGLEPGVPQSGEPFSAGEAAGQQQQNQSAGTAQVEFDAENAGAGQEIGFESDPQLNQESAGASQGQQTQFDSGQQQQGGGSDTSGIREHMEVIGADGVHLGTVDKVEGDRIKLTKADSGMGSHEGHHHYISCGLVAGVEGDKVRLSATAANAYGMEEEQ